MILSMVMTVWRGDKEVKWVERSDVVGGRK